MSNISLILFPIFLLLIVIQTTESFTDVPPPPPRPDKFKTREQLKKYLQEVHQYYAIIGRPRFGRQVPSSVNYPMTMEDGLFSSDHHHKQRQPSSLTLPDASSSSSSLDVIFDFLDVNGDNCIIRKELKDRLQK